MLTRMPLHLANAQTPDLSGSTWRILLLSIAVIAVVTGLALVPMVLARRRAHRWTEALTLGTVAWGLLTAGSIVWIAFAQFNWSQEQMRLIKTGYYDSRNTADAPVWPWALWAVLAVTYGVIVVLSAIRKRPA